MVEIELVLKFVGIESFFGSCFSTWFQFDIQSLLRKSMFSLPLSSSLALRKNIKHKHVVCILCSQECIWVGLEVFFEPTQKMWIMNIVFHLTLNYNFDLITKIVKKFKDYISNIHHTYFKFEIKVNTTTILREKTNLYIYIYKPKKIFNPTLGPI